MNSHVKENLDEETLKLMLEKADSNKDGKVSFEDFYSVMIKDIYWEIGQLLDYFTMYNSMSSL